MFGHFPEWICRQPPAPYSDSELLHFQFSLFPFRLPTPLLEELDDCLQRYVAKLSSRKKVS